MPAAGTAVVLEVERRREQVGEAVQLLSSHRRLARLSASDAGWPAPATAAVTAGQARWMLRDGRLAAATVLRSVPLRHPNGG